MNSFFKEYFTFSRRDRAGIVALSVFIIAAIVVPKMLSLSKPQPTPTDFTAFKEEVEQYSAEIDSAQKAAKAAYYNNDDTRPKWKNEGDANDPNFDPAEAVAVKLQPFDPNELTYQSARQLGLPARTAHTIENFLQKGGKFYKKEDLKKIYVLSDADYLRIEPYIQIPPRNDKTFADKGSTANNTINFEETKLQAFDPNKLNFEAAKQLGLSDKTAHTIENYIQKGGRFYKKEDLKKIYALPEADYQRIEPYIQIPPTENKPGTTQTAEAQVPTTYSVGYKRDTSANKNTLRKPIKISKPININTADTTEWQQLKGIGSGYARQIVKYRSQLGGFAYKEQIKEVYGMTSELYTQIEPYLQGAGSVKQVDINKASADEMKMHPYIKYKLADAIVKYRQQHGVYKVIDDIKNIKIITGENYTKLAPYLKTD